MENNRTEKTYLNGELISEKHVVFESSQKEKWVWFSKSNIELAVKIASLAAIIVAGCQLYYDRQDKLSEQKKQLKEDQRTYRKEIRDSILNASAAQREDLSIRLKQLEIDLQSKDQFRDYLQRENQFAKAFEQQMLLLSEEAAQRRIDISKDRQYSAYTSAIDNLAAIQNDLTSFTANESHVISLGASILKTALIADSASSELLKKAQIAALRAGQWVRMRNEILPVVQAYEKLTSEFFFALNIPPDKYLDTMAYLSTKAYRIVEYGIPKVNDLPITYQNAAQASKEIIVLSNQAFNFMPDLFQQRTKEIEQKEDSLKKIINRYYFSLIKDSIITSKTLNEFEEMFHPAYKRFLKQKDRFEIPFKIWEKLIRYYSDYIESLSREVTINSSRRITSQ